MQNDLIILMILYTFCTKMFKDFIITKQMITIIFCCFTFPELILFIYFDWPILEKTKKVFQWTFSQLAAASRKSTIWKLVLKTLESWRSSTVSCLLRLVFLVFHFSNVSIIGNNKKNKNVYSRSVSVYMGFSLRRRVSKDLILVLWKKYKFFCVLKHQTVRNKMRILWYIQMLQGMRFSKRYYEGKLFEDYCIPKNTALNNGSV